MTNEYKFPPYQVRRSYLHNIQSQWVANLNKATESYKKEYAPNYYDLLAQYYSDVEGPYLLGDEITYADFAVYQSIDNDTRTGTIPVSAICTPFQV